MMNRANLQTKKAAPDKGFVAERRRQIRRLSEAVAREFRPDKIVLFGSYAYGQPRPDSDVDLLVVMPFAGSPFRQASLVLGHIIQAVGVLPLDILVRTAEQVQERLNMGDDFMREIAERGQLLYEGTAREHFRLAKPRMKGAATPASLRPKRSVG
jgi:predicted nucleotidyltransferase